MAARWLESSHLGGFMVHNTSPPCVGSIAATNCYTCPYTRLGCLVTFVEIPTATMKLSEKVKLWKARSTTLLSDGAIHWRAPAVMVCSLFSGILISFVHDIFNRLMNGHGAGGATEQQWVRRVETAFAFASRLFLCISTMVAYTQYLWFYLQRNTSRMASLDAMFSATNNSFRFIHVRLWRNRPILALIALVTWFMIPPYARHH